MKPTTLSVVGFLVYQVSHEEACNERMSNQADTSPPGDNRAPEAPVTVVRFQLQAADGRQQTALSLILSNGDIHHFYCLSDGVHHSYNRRYRSNYAAALAAELSRPGASVVREVR